MCKLYYNLSYVTLRGQHAGLEIRLSSDKILPFKMAVNYAEIDISSLCKQVKNLWHI